MIHIKYLPVGKKISCFTRKQDKSSIIHQSNIQLSHVLYLGKSLLPSSNDTRCSNSTTSIVGAVSFAGMTMRLVPRQNARILAWLNSFFPVAVFEFVFLFSPFFSHVYNPLEGIFHFPSTVLTRFLRDLGPKFSNVFKIV